MPGDDEADDDDVDHGGKLIYSLGKYEEMKQSSLVTISWIKSDWLRLSWGQRWFLYFVIFIFSSLGFCGTETACNQSQDKIDIFSIEAKKINFFCFYLTKFSLLFNNNEKNDEKPW